MSPDLIETIRTSPLTPWIGGGILLFLLFTLVKFVAKTVGKLIVTAIIGITAFLGWNWWGENDQRSFADIRQDWFASVKGTDFSKQSISALAKDTSRLLKEATVTSQAKGRAVTRDVLAKMAASLNEKIQEAASKGETEAQEHCQRLYNEVQVVTAKLATP